MNLPKIAISLVLVGALSACLQLPEIEQPGDDAGTQPDASAEESDAGVPPTLALFLNEQHTTLHAKASVSVHVELTGDDTGAVDILAGDTLMLSLQPPYDAAWDTRVLEEGTYSVRARVQHGDTPIYSAPITLVVDRTPPHVVLREPAPGNTSASVKQGIRAEFSEPLASETVTDNTVRLSRNGTNQTKTLSLSQEGKVLTITPTSPLLSPADISVTLSADIVDLAGNGISPPTSAWTWHAPEWLNLTNGLGAGGIAPILRINNAGQPVVAWLESSNAYVRQLTNTGWLDIGGPLNANPGNTPVNNLAMALNSQGYPVVAWSESDGISKNIYVREWTGSHWKIVGDVLSANSGATDAMSPSLQLKNDTTPVVAWSESDGSVKNIYVRELTAQGWQQPFGNSLSANAGTTHAEAPRLGLDTFGYPVVAWLESDGTAVNLYVKRWVGAAWQDMGDPVSNASGSTDVVDYDMTLDAAGNPTVAWFENDLPESINYQVHVWRWSMGISSPSWEHLGGSLNGGRVAGDFVGISVQLDSYSNPMVSWVEVDENRMFASMHLSQWLNTKWQSLNLPPNQSPGAPCLAFDSAHTPHLGWVDSGEYGLSIQVSRRNQ